jgi:hypothetical protein
MQELTMAGQFQNQSLTSTYIRKRGKNSKKERKKRTRVSELNTTPGSSLAQEIMVVTRLSTTKAW